MLQAGDKKGKSGELALKDLIDNGRVGFAFALFHDETFEGVDGGGFARFVIGHTSGVSGDGVVAPGFELGGIADLLQAEFFDEVAGSFAGGEHFVEKVFGLFGIDFARGDEIGQGGEVGGG